MNLYIGDTHFGHRNVIGFDHRPFSTVEEMDEVMIRLWNGRVQPDDNVWFLGDFCHKSGKAPEWYLKRLAGRKHLILGNHDQPLYENDTALAYFESVDQIARVNDTYKGENITAVLCHYPILEWWHKHHGVWHIY
nr:metallophosphoesterase [Lachnospiraceae bacterium]